jgi:AcrR family transcriptional regulator
MPRDALLDRVTLYAAEHGIADKSLREIASGVGTSHRMLLYHFGSREGLLAAIVAAVEDQQRAVLAALSEGGDPAAVMLGLWEQVSQPSLRPFVRLFFAAVGLAVQGVPGTEAVLDNLTAPWLDQGGEAARRLGVAVDPAALRLGVAVARGLLLELVAGADPAEVDASYRLFVEVWRRSSLA